MYLAVVGDFSVDELGAKVQDRLGDWSGGAPLDLPTPPAVAPRFEQGVYLVPRTSPSPTSSWATSASVGPTPTGTLFRLWT